MLATPEQYADGEPFAQIVLPDHYIDHVAGRDILFVTFDNASIRHRESDRLEQPWGYKLLKRLGWGILGIKPRVADWYRHPDIHAFFDSQVFRDIVARYPRVIFYGGSMGGFGALTFARAVPGSEVIALNPQTTMDRRLAPWETRFKEGLHQDWRGAYADAADGARTASRVFVAYDPLLKPDRRHVDRLTGGNLVRLKVPMVGHGLPNWLLQMGILKNVVTHVVDGTLDEATFARWARARRRIPRYYEMLYARTKNPAVRARCVEALRSLDTRGQPFNRTHYAALLRLDLLDDAILAAKRAAAASDDAEAEFILGKLFAKAKKWKRAAAAYDRALELAPDNALIHFHLAVALHRRGELADAERHIRRAIELDPSSDRYRDWRAGSSSDLE